MAGILACYLYISSEIHLQIQKKTQFQVNSQENLRLPERQLLTKANQSDTLIGIEIFATEHTRRVVVTILEPLEI